MAPSNLTVSAVRKLAKRRGYKLHKLYGKDRFWLQDESQSPPYGRIYDNEDCVVIEDCCFTQYGVVEFLKAEPIPDAD